MSKIENFLKEDISKLASNGDWVKIRKVETYLNRMARQRLSRLEKANLEIGDDRILSRYSKYDFQSTYIPKGKDLKRYNNQMLKSIANARHFLNLKTSKVTSFKSWNKKVGKSDYVASKEFWKLKERLEEIDMSGFGSLGSEVQNEITAYMEGQTKKKDMSDYAKRGYDKMKNKLKNAKKGTIQEQIYNEYIKNGVNPEDFSKKDIEEEAEIWNELLK